MCRGGRSGGCRVVVLLLTTIASVVVDPANSSFPKRIPIGLLFGSDDPMAVQTAVRYEIEKHNNSSSTVFRLDRYEKLVDATDSFDVCKALCATISHGIFALFGFSNETTRAAIDAFTRTFHMPYVTASAPINDSHARHTGDWNSTATSSTSTSAARHRAAARNGGFTIHLRPLFDRAALDIIRHYRWRNISYVYDSNDGLVRLEHLYSIANAQESVMEVDAVRVEDVTQCYVALRQLDSRSPAGTRKFIILDLSTNYAVQAVLKQVQAVGMNRAGYHYLIVGLTMDELELDEFRHGGVNITGFSLLDPDSSALHSFHRQWSHLDPKYWHGAGRGHKITLTTALAVDAMSVILHGLRSMLINPDSEIFHTFRRGQVYNNGTRGLQCRTGPPVPWVHGPAILNSFLTTNFHGVTGLVAFDENGFRKNYKLNVLELNLNKPVRKIASWDYNTGLNIEKKLTQHTTIALSANRTRIVTTIISKPYLDYRKPKHDEDEVFEGNERFEGYCADLAKAIAKELQAGGIPFNYELRLVRDGIYGSKKTDGTWNGMIGELTTKQADLAIAPLTITSIRERVVDFSKPFMDLGISIMIKKPEKQKPGVFSFMDPLDRFIWLSIVLSYVGVSFVLFLVSRFSPHEWQIEDRENGPTFTNDFTILNSLWFALGAFMRQGIDISPRSLSGRIVGSAWWFFTLIIISSYTANLAAFLTIERMLTPIESADDLVKQREIQYGTLNAGSTKDFFRGSKVSVYARMWDYMHSNPSLCVDTTDIGVEKVRNSKGKYAFLLESTMNEYHNQRKPCNTMKVGDNLDSKGYGIATPIGSSLRDPIGLTVLELIEQGELQKLHKKWWIDKGECVADDSKGSSQSALTLSNVAGIFYILIGGLGVSMIISLLEYVYKSKKQIVRQKKTFTESTRSKSRATRRTTPDRENGGYSYTAPTQVSGFEQYADSKNTHTQV